MPLKIRKHHSLTTRYVIIVGLLLFAANIILGLVMLNQSKSMMKTMITKNMLDISNTAADLLDGDVMEALTEDDVGTPVFQAISDMLFVFMNNADIEFIYAVRQVDKDTYVFTVDPDPVDPGEFGEEILVTNALVQAARGIATVDNAPAADRWGNFYSAYSPIFNSKGEVAGVVGLDFSAQWYEEQIRQHTFSITIISMVSVLVGAAVMILITSKVRRKFKELDNGLSDLAKNLDALAEEISSDPGYKQSMTDVSSPVRDSAAVADDENGRIARPSGAVAFPESLHYGAPVGVGDKRPGFVGIGFDAEEGASSLVGKAEVGKTRQVEGFPLGRLRAGRQGSHKGGDEHDFLHDFDILRLIMGCQSTGGSEGPVPPESSTHPRW